MSRRRFWLVVLLFAVAALSCSAANRPACAGGGPLRVLFIGNSYTYANDLPHLFEKLAAAGSPPGAVTQMVAVGGSTLAEHWNRGEAAKAIASGCWDYVVLQEQSLIGGYVVTNDAGSFASFKAAVINFNEEIRKKGAKTALFVTWARQKTPDMQDRLNAAYKAAAGPTGAMLVQVGPAWQRSRRQRSDIALHQADGSHPSAAGSYLAACVFYAALLNKPPRALPAIGIPAEQATFLQQVAIAP